MTSYKEFQAELEKLHREAERARRNEQREALEKIRALIIEYQLLPSDLGFADSPKRRGKHAAKYRDPATGATWSGYGRAPQWMAGKDRALFLV